MAGRNKTVWGVIGVILILFGIIGTIPILVSKEYTSWLPFTGFAVIIGVVLAAYAFSD